MCRFLVLLFLGVSASTAAGQQPDAPWAFHHLIRPEPPAHASLQHAGVVRNPINLFLLDKLEAAGLDPALAADGAMLGLMGIDPEKLTYLFAGSFRYLTDVDGQNNLAPRFVRSGKKKLTTN